MTTAPRASVIIPTRNRPLALSRCLNALRRQTIAAELEIIVVDDGSDDPTAVVKAAGPERVLRHERPRGPAAARTTGAAASVAPVVLLTDDDCEPAYDWAERLVTRLETGSDAVAGRTVNARPEDPLAEASQLIANALVRPVEEAAARVEFAPSSNLACHRWLLVSLPFDETFPCPAGEDRDWCARLAAAGFGLDFERAAVVRHYQELDLRSFWRQHVRYGVASRRVRSTHPNAVAGGLAVSLALVRRGFARNVRVGLLVALSQVATAWGTRRSAGRHRAATP